ncbi:MAG: universal stress protein [Thaumarchaeota archaeon]|nr:universal stress protein [Nitrososphaerota archaeon]
MIFTKEILFGQESKKIIDFAQKEKFDLSDRVKRLGHVKRMILDSVANSVVDKSKIPVLVIR